MLVGKVDIERSGLWLILVRLKGWMESTAVGRPWNLRNSPYGLCKIESGLKVSWNKLV